MIADSAATGVTGDIIRRSAERSPQRASIVFDGESVSYAELDRKTQQCAHALAERFAPGAKIGFMLSNSLAYAVGFYGAARSGCVSVHVSPRYTPSELAYVCRQTGAEAWIVDAKTRPTAEATFHELGVAPHLIDASGFDAFLEGHPETPVARTIRPEDPFCIQYTSGTTGHPKGVVLSHRSRILSAVAAVEDIPLHAEDVLAVTTPLCHAAGIFTWFQPALLAGATCIFLRGWSPKELIAQVAAHGITGAFMVPSQIAMILEEVNRDGRDGRDGRDELDGLDGRDGRDGRDERDGLDGLQKVVYGGAPASQELLERAEAALPHVTFVQALGSTETGHLLCQTPEERRKNPQAVGKPGPRIEHCLFTEKGDVASPGEVGELAVRGPVLMEGYLKAPEETRAYFKSDDGWGFTGDLALADDEGVLTLVGRTKERILSGGINVYPAELEGMISEHPDVFECAVFAVPDEKWGELPAAAVVRRDGASVTEGELSRLCREARGALQARPLYLLRRRAAENGERQSEAQLTEEELLRLPLRASLRVNRLQLDAEPVSETVREGEITGDLVDIQDRAVAEACFAQRENILLHHVPRPKRELLGIFEHRAVRVGELGVAPVRDEIRDEGVVLGELTEPRPVMFDSVVALVRHGGHDRDHLPLLSCQIGAAAHHRRVERKVHVHRARVEGMYLENVVHTAPRLGVFLVELFQPAGRLGFGNHVNPGHRLAPRGVSRTSRCLRGSSFRSWEP